MLELNPASLGAGLGSFDVLTSWLVFLHIERKRELLSRCADLLRPGGTLYVEDFFERAPFSPAERRALEVDVYASSLPTREEYIAALCAAGFADIEWRDMTGTWTTFVGERAAAWEASKGRTLRVHGATLYEGMGHFFGSMSDLFSGGNLGGVRITARLPR